MRLLSSAFLLTSLSFFSLASLLFFQRLHPLPAPLAFSNPHIEASTDHLTPLPTRLAIPSLQINLPIYPAKLQNRRWATSSHGVSYLSSTPLPGQPGNSILYGHNWPRLLGKLTQATSGQRLTVDFSDGTTQHFTITQLSQVVPDHTDILNPTPHSQLTLYTCTGFLDRHRLVVVAVPTDSAPDPQTSLLPLNSPSPLVSRVDTLWLTPQYSIN